MNKNILSAMMMGQKATEEPCLFDDINAADGPVVTGISCNCPKCSPR